MTNKRKMQRARRIYGNLNVKKRKELNKQALMNAIVPYEVPLRYLFYDVMVSRYFRCRREALLRSYAKITKAS